MIEGFLLGVLFTWPSFTVMCILAIIAESLGKTKTALVLVILSMLAVYILTSVSLPAILATGIGYIVVGILWSFWRYKKFVRDEYKEAILSTSYSDNPDIRTNKLASVKIYSAPDKVIDKILSWIVIWPLSVVSVFISDVVVYLKDFIQKYLKNVYARIHKSVFKEL